MSLPLPPLSSIPAHHPHCCLALSTNLINILTQLILSVAPARLSDDHVNDSVRHRLDSRGTTDSEAQPPFDAGPSPDSPRTTTATTTPSISSNQDQTQTSLIVLSIGSGSGLLEALLQASLNAFTTAPITSSSPPSSQSSTLSLHTLVEGVEVSSLRSITSSSTILQPEAQLNRYLPAQSHHTVPGTWSLHPRAAAAHVWMFVYPRDPGLVRGYLRMHGKGEGKVRMVIWLGPRRDWEEGFREVFAVEGEGGEDEGKGEDALEPMWGVEVYGDDDADRVRREGTERDNGMESGLPGFEMLVVARRKGG